MRSFRKTVACLVAVLMVLSVCSAAFTASAAATSGACGEHATWVIENGTLTISGDGAMYDYNFDAPWGDGSGMRYYSNIVINPGITYIGSRAFYGSTASSVSIPNTVTVLGDCAFHWSGLTSVTIPGSITSWQNAFNLCLNLSYVTIENGVTTIDSACFGGCSNLSYVSLPDSLTSIGNGAFVGCTSLTSIDLPFNLISIDDGAFQNTGLTTVSLPHSVNTVGMCAFSDSTLTSIELSPYMSSIAQGMFNNCSSLESITIPGSVTTIGEYAFNGCASLDRVYYGDSQQQWDAITIGEGNQALDNARIICSDSPSSLLYCGNNATWSIENGVLSISGRGAMYDYGTTPYLVPDWAYQGFTGVEVGENITSIGAQAFQQITTITSLVTFSGLESIGDNAFCGCTGLTSTVFANNLRSIGDLAFSNCDGLTSFDIPNQVWSLGDYAFQQCDNLTTLTIGIGVTELGYGTFQECPALTTINYNAVNAMDLASNNYLFAGVPNANTPVTVNIGSDVWYIPANLFRLGAPGYGPAITTVNIPVGLSAIGAGAFKNCTTIADVYYSGTKQQWNALNIGADNDPLTNAAIHCSDGTILPANACGEHTTWSIANGVLTISGSGAMFDYDPPGDQTPWVLSGESYSSIVISSGVTSIGEWAFGYSPATSVSIPNTVTTIGSNAFSASALTSVTIPGSVTSWQEAFILCNSLTSATIQSGVELIDVMSFGGCSGLTSVTIPDTVTEIGFCAFQYCSDLETISLPGGVTDIGNNAFEGCTSLTDVYFNGTRQEWNAITKGTDNDPLTDANLHCNIDYTCGDDLTWAIENGTLTITGTGDMYDYNNGYAGEPDLPGWVNETFSSVVISSGVTSIGDFAFEDSPALTSVSIPASVASIGRSAFNSCNMLNAVYITDLAAWCGISFYNAASNPLMYANSLYLNGTHVSNLVIPNTVERIEDNAFNSCALQSVTIPDSVTYIGAYSFICSSLRSVNIPSSVTEIGDSAFRFCTALTELEYDAVNLPDFDSDANVFSGAGVYFDGFTVTFGGSVQRIPANLFYISDWTENPEFVEDNLPNVITVNIGSNVESIGNSAFYGCTTITDVNYGGTQQQWNAITKGTNNEPLLSATIHCAVDYTCGDNLTWSIENGVLTVSGTGAMYDYARYGADAPWRQSNAVYTGIVIGSNVTHIGENAFYYSPATSVSLPNTLTSIGSNAFAQSSLTSVTIPGSVTSWPRAFRMCNSLTSATILSGVTTLDECCFAGCLNLTDVTIPASVTSIGNMAFQVCESLTGVILPANLVSIGSNAFDGSGLTGITLPANLVSIGEAAFYHSALTEITIPDSVTTIGGGAFASTPLEEFTFPAHVTAVPSFILEYCDSLSSVTIPDGVTEIGEYAFRDCTSLQTVYMPASVEAIAANAFAVCTALTDVYFNGTQELWDEISIGSHNTSLTNATIHFVEPEDTYSLSVGDQVSVNLILDLDTRGLTVSDVSVTLDGQPVETTVTYDGDQYRFTIITAPAQIADEIVITVGDETITTTVMDYCTTLCGHEYDAYEKEQNLAKAILQYGKAANEVFDWTDEEITTFGELDHQPVQAYTGAIFTDGTHKITGASFMALARPVFRFYMSGVSEAEAAAYNNANNITAAYSDPALSESEQLNARFLKATRDGETFVLVEVTGISAENMNEEVAVSIPGLGQFTFNGNAFAKAMANDSDPVTQNFGAALYNYGAAANACFKPVSQEDQP